MTRRVRQQHPFVLPLSNDSRQRGFVKRIPQCGERAAQFGGSQTGAVCESTGNSASGGQSHSARHHGGKSSRAFAGICATVGNHAALANGASGPAANDSPQHIAAAPEHNHHYRSHARQHAASEQSIRELRCCPTSSCQSIGSQSWRTTAKPASAGEQVSAAAGEAALRTEVSRHGAAPRTPAGTTAEAESARRKACRSHAGPGISAAFRAGDAFCTTTCCATSQTLTLWVSKFWISTLDVVSVVAFARKIEGPQ